MTKIILLESADGLQRLIPWYEGVTKKIYKPLLPTFNMFDTNRELPVSREYRFSNVRKQGDHEIWVYREIL